MRFNGQAWELFGDVITGEVGHERAIVRAAAIVAASPEAGQLAGS